MFLTRRNTHQRSTAMPRAGAIPCWVVPEPRPMCKFPTPRSEAARPVGPVGIQAAILKMNNDWGGHMKRLLVLALFLAVTPALFAQQAVPEIPFDSVANFFKLPADLHFGEASGVAVNSKGHIFVFNRRTTTGPAYG